MNLGSFDKSFIKTGDTSISILACLGTKQWLIIQYYIQEQKQNITV